MPNVVGGINTECIKIVIILYWRVIESIVSSRMAEAVKMVENIFVKRDVSIAFVYQIALIFE